MPAKSIAISPSGLLDLRSEPGDIAPADFRYILNLQKIQKKNPCRLPGWNKLLDSDEGYNNADLHDQLLSITGHSARQPITFLYSAESTLKTTMLFASTAEALYQLNTGTKNWRVISSSIGGFTQATQNRDTIIFTNDRDEPRYWVFDTPNGDSSLQLIDDLVVAGITRVGVVVTFRNITLYMNCVENGRTFANRIHWSNIDNPLDLLPGNDSTAGSIDLPSGETILNAMPLANSLLIYTTRGIWQMVLVGGDEVFAISKRYEPERSNEGVLTYRNTLLSTGETHIYMGQSAIYEYSLFEPRPKLIEWVHKASSIIFDEIDRANCYGPVSGFDSDRHHIWMSWTANGSALPTRSLVFNTQTPFTSIVDHGFTAFGQFQPRDQAVLRNFLLETCVCSPEELTEFFGDFSNEGGYCNPPAAPVCDTQPDSLFSTVSLELEDGIVMEDFNGDPTENSFCSRLALVSESLSDLCSDEAHADQCNATRLFVMASADDFCLKQTSDSYYREACVNFTGCGTYEQRGYKSILRSGPLNFKNLDDDKRFEHFLADCSVVPSLIPGQLTLRVGASRQPLDPNLDCGIIWQLQPSIELECQEGRTEAEHLANNTRPDGEFQWPLFWIGQYLYFELTIENKNSSPIDTGGAACFSRFVLAVTPLPVRY